MLPVGWRIFIFAASLFFDLLYVSEILSRCCYSRILFSCVPAHAAAVDADAHSAAAAVETKQRTVPASGLATPTYTHTRTLKSKNIAPDHALSLFLSPSPLNPLPNEKIFVNKFDYVFSYVYV